jgi:hypothetical protein
MLLCCAKDLLSSFGGLQRTKHAFHCLVEAGNEFRRVDETKGYTS